MVIDASVLVDMFVANRTRHSLALKLAYHIKASKIAVTIPLHALLEMKCAIDCERKTLGCGNLANDLFSEDEPLRIKYIAIDNAFINKYLDLSVPYIRAGDLPYVLVAKKHNCPLITEDNQQYKVAKQAGVATYKIDEYLKSVSVS